MAVGKSGLRMEILGKAEKRDGERVQGVTRGTGCVIAKRIGSNKVGPFSEVKNFFTKIVPNYIDI